MWQKHTQVKLSTKDYSCSIRGDYQTGPYFYKREAKKKKREDKALPNETNSSYSSDSVN